MTKEQLAFLFDPDQLREIALEPGEQREPPLHVTRYDSGDRFLVRSASKVARETGVDGEEVITPWHYLVDLGDKAFPKGRCQCDDFGYRKEPKIKRRQKPFRWTCKHIEAVQAELFHARNLCEDAGLEFSPMIIPTIAEYEHRQHR